MTQIADPAPQGEATIVRAYRPGDEEAIVRVLETVFGNWPAFDLGCEPIDHWRWRYLEAPGNPKHLFVGEAGGEIIGCLHHTLVDMKIGDRFFPAMLGGDIAILEAFRARGLLAEFSRAAINRRKMTGHWFSYFESQNPKVVNHYRKSAYPLPIQSRHLLRVKNIRLHLARQQHSRRWFKTLVFESLRILNQMAHIHDRSFIDTELNLSRIENFDERFDEFWERNSDHYRLIVKRDRSYLNWRYADARAGTYRLLCAQDDQGLVGYLVLRINKKDSSYPVGYVVDLLCIPGRDDAARALLAEGLRYFDAKQVNAVHCLVPRRHPYRRVFAAQGFVDTMERTVVFLRNNKPMDQQLASLDSMAPNQAYYSYGDIDTI